MVIYILYSEGGFSPELFVGSSFEEAVEEHKRKMQGKKWLFASEWQPMHLTILPSWECVVVELEYDINGNFKTSRHHEWAIYQAEIDTPIRFS